jgi:hypothetical protein
MACNVSDVAKVWGGPLTLVFKDPWASIPDYLTSGRGRGGLGSANQHLFQYFFRMSDDAGTAWAIQSLIHTYIF